MTHNMINQAIQIGYFMLYPNFLKKFFEGLVNAKI